jgi:hypothetical protein
MNLIFTSVPFYAGSLEGYGFLNVLILLLFIMNNAKEIIEFLFYLIYLPNGTSL